MRYFFVLLLCLPLFVWSQVFDDFEDGDFTNNPQWTGTTDKFIINTNNRLQLDDTDAGLSFLSTSNTTAIDVEWRLWIKLSFSPSDNNNARFYLISDQQDVTQALNGYFLQFGEGGSDDAIELFRQDGSSTQSVCRGTDGLLASSFEIRIRVTRDDSGNWQVFTDPTGSDNFRLECEGNDPTYASTNYIGLYCKYTVSNSTKFYFDDVYAGEIIVDNDPPVLLSVSPGTNTSLLLIFNESLEAQSAENVENYVVDNEIGTPVSATLVEGNASQVVLEFDDVFVNGFNYTLSVSGIKDLAENIMAPQQISFSYVVTTASDLVINEIMADPSPQVGLPNFEYLELFNQTDANINLNDWTLTIGTSDKIFENVSIEPNGYLIVAKDDAEPELSVYGSFYGFSSFSLTNSGQILELKNKDGVLISSVTYDDNWYKDPDKEDGGWSLEQINPSNICSGGDNWLASNDPRGGTPGTENSVYDDIILLPGVERFEVFANNILHLYFNQAMDLQSLEEAEHYSVDKGIENPSIVFINENESNFTELYFSDAFQPGEVYNLTVKSGVTNCLGLQMPNDTTIGFGLAETADSLDIVINEVLFNPWTNGVDYVEIYNRSSKIIDLSSLQLGTIRYSPPNPPDTSFYSISYQQHILIPEAYALLTSSPESVMKQYYTSNADAFVKVDPFPAYNNDEGTVMLTTVTSQVLDLFNYSEDMHYPLLNYVDGVSLERVNVHTATSDQNNWHSAAESVGFGTPAYLNSQYIHTESTDEPVVLEPEIFSPDNDGYNDLISIKYTFDQPGYNMTTQIYNAKGQLVRELVNNEYLGTAGSVNWDGIKDDNSKASIGIYVFYIQIFDLEGNVKHYKKTGVLATKL
ncbi:MAG: lamin tail domain-containing protein [Bacteroidetes bacterium]|nr:lamin tail domain-containing protein [Bacteroidota bacterium]